ncbi:unnamed protein product [Owenia fusiformis]|uniref:Uncharacterized protein n=1 Tax=Owenia fusiformis TaxID=6347 RepID=A0A8S4N3Z0_OWEFU|nr:unnamed protein product [Owenia fusiformis]
MASLHRALDDQHWHQFRLLVEVGVNVNAIANDGKTALLRICNYNMSNRQATYFTKLLLKYGANKNAIDPETGCNVLGLAIKHNRECVCRVLLQEMDFDFNQQDHNGNTALHLLALEGTMPYILMKIINCMVKFEIVIDVRNNEGYTPLMLACKRGHLETARTFANIGNCSLTMRDNTTFKSPIDLLREAIEIPTDVDPLKNTKWKPNIQATTASLSQFDSSHVTSRRPSSALPSVGSSAPTIYGKSMRRKHRPRTARFKNVRNKSSSLISLNMNSFGSLALDSDVKFDTGVSTRGQVSTFQNGVDSYKDFSNHCESVVVERDQSFRPMFQQLFKVKEEYESPSFRPTACPAEPESSEFAESELLSEITESFSGTLDETTTERLRAYIALINQQKRERRGIPDIQKIEEAASAISLIKKRISKRPSGTRPGSSLAKLVCQLTTKSDPSSMKSPDGEGRNSPGKKTMKPGPRRSISAGGNMFADIAKSLQSNTSQSASNEKLFDNEQTSPIGSRPTSAARKLKLKNIFSLNQSKTSFSSQSTSASNSNSSVSLSTDSGSRGVDSMTPIEEHT